jgi:hypothetical protein
LRRDSGHITCIGWAIYSLEEEFDASGQSLRAGEKIANLSAEIPNLESWILAWNECETVVKGLMGKTLAALHGLVFHSAFRSLPVVTVIPFLFPVSAPI